HRDAGSGEGGEGGEGGDGSGEGSQNSSATRTPETEENSEPMSDMTFRLYAGQRSNIQAALEKSGEVAGSEAPNHQLDVICLEYLAHHVEGSPTARLRPIMDGLEAHFPVKLFAVPNKVSADDIMRIDTLLQEVAGNIKKSKR
ncbi:unnamed protein product, partial [marine sediment metagenome]